MSFLAEVLSNVETVHLEEINNKVPELSLQLENLKTDVMNYTDNVYVKFSHRPKENSVLLNKASCLRDGLLSLQTTVESTTKEDIVKSNLEIEKQAAALQKIHLTLQIVLNVREITDSLLKYRCLLKKKSYVECMDLIKSTVKTLKLLQTDECVDAIHMLHQTAVTEQLSLNNVFRNIFSDNVVFIEKGDTFILKVKEQNDEMKQVLCALYKLNPVVHYLQDIIKFMWHNVFTPIVNCVTEIVVEGEKDAFVLSVKITNATESASYTHVFKNLKIVLNFLKDYFNYQVDSDGFTVLGYIGRETRDNLSEMLIKNCLQATIPSTTEELQRYKVVIEDTEKLETFLRECGVFTSETTSIFEYASNIDVLFINKKCKEYLQAAEVIMKKDLHDMIEVGEPFDHKNTFSESVNGFSQCFISKSTVELLEMADRILQQVVKASDTASGRLFYTVQNIFQKYCTQIPVYHQKLLQTIPQQVALFHNNCKYLASELTKLNENYSSKIDSILNAGQDIFQTEIIQLERTGDETFATYVCGQISQIQEIMKEASLDIQSIDKLEPITEKCVRQCVRQQELLKTVWQNVLSYHIYNKTLGRILDALCTILIDAIVKFEDISDAGAQQLVDILKIILSRGPKLFTDQNEVSLFVPSWYKFNELNYILNSSLLDINNRWADGKGPLALQFTANDIRQLIRALFQNTDRRAALLAKIQN